MDKKSLDSLFDLNCLSEIFASRKTLLLKATITMDLAMYETMCNPIFE